MMIRTATESDFPAILQLNLEWEHFLSPMGEDRLNRLHAMAGYHRVVELNDGLAGFLLAFREGAEYDSSNYRWFAEQYDHFLYIDRIVVATDRQGQGFGARLYENLFQAAAEQGVSRVTCEYDINPPNERSRQFHQRFGFAEVGRRRDANTGKEVSLQSAEVSKWM